MGRIRHPIVHEKARYEEAAVVVGPLNHKEEEEAVVVGPLIHKKAHQNYVAPQSSLL